MAAVLIGAMLSPLLSPLLPLNARHGSLRCIESNEKQPGKRRLEARDEIRGLKDGKLQSILGARMQSALKTGRVPLGEQPPQLRSGLSVEQERQRMAIVERRFSFAPLDAEATAQLSAELAEAGATLAQGIGLRNNLYREKQAAGRAMKLTRELPATWTELPAASSSLQVPPLDLMRRMVASRAIPRNGKLTIKLASGLVEALVEAHAACRTEGGELAVSTVLGTKRVRKLRYGPARAVKAAVQHLAADSTFLPTVAWACANDLQGAERKQVTQRRSRAAERLVIRRLRAAGVQGRTEAQLGARTTTPDFILDAAPREVVSGLRWIDVKHSVGQGDASKISELVRRYCEDWGPGVLLFTLGYTEAYAEALRAAAPVWVLDAHAAERMLLRTSAE